MYSDLIKKWSRGVLESLRSVRPAFGINSRQLLEGSYVSRGDNLPWFRATSGIRKRDDLFIKSDFCQNFQVERGEILRHKWFESEKASHDIGFEKALLDWVLHQVGLSDEPGRAISAPSFRLSASD